MKSNKTDMLTLRMLIEFSLKFQAVYVRCCHFSGLTMINDIFPCNNYGNDRSIVKTAVKEKANINRNSPYTLSQNVPRTI